MSDESIKSSKRVLEPYDRVSEVLFGLIMVLTFTGSLSIAEAGRDDIRTMLIGALGCNLAWGIIDGVLYLMGCLAEKGTRPAHLARRAQSRGSAEGATAHRGRAAAAGRLHSAAGGTRNHAPASERAARAARARAARARTNGWGALGVFLLVFLSTFPVVDPVPLHEERRAGPARLQRHRHRDVVPDRLCVRAHHRPSARG